jgi:hypothetical protein
MFIVYFNYSRAISTTRTVFRLNTNQGDAYEVSYKYIIKLNYLK